MRISDWSSDVCSSDLLDVAGAQFDAVVEILVFALVPDLHGTAVARLVLADAHAFGIVAIGAEGRGACRADPLAAALMAALLFLEALFQRPIGRASCRERVCQYV